MKYTFLFLSLFNLSIQSMDLNKEYVNVTLESFDCQDCILIKPQWIIKEYSKDTLRLIGIDTKRKYAFFEDDLNKNCIAAYILKENLLELLQQEKKTTIIGRLISTQSPLKRLDLQKTQSSMIMICPRYDYHTQNAFHPTVFFERNKFDESKKQTMNLNDLIGKYNIIKDKIFNILPMSNKKFVLQSFRSLTIFSFNPTQKNKLSTKKVIKEDPSLRSKLNLSETIPLSCSTKLKKNRDLIKCFIENIGRGPNYNKKITIERTNLHTGKLLYTRTIDISQNDVRDTLINVFIIRRKLIIAIDGKLRIYNLFDVRKKVKTISTPKENFLLCGGADLIIKEIDHGYILANKQGIIKIEA